MTIFREMAEKHLVKRLIDSIKTKKYNDVKPIRKVTFNGFRQ